MGLGNTLLVIALILGVLWFMYPDEFQEYTEKFVDKMKEIRDNNIEPNYVETEDGKDYGKIFGHLDCVQDSDCEEAFGLEDIICADSGNCIKVINNG